MLQTINYTWDQFDNDVIILAEQVKQSGFKPNILIGLARGGSVLATALSYKLNIPVHYINPKIDIPQLNESVRYLIIDEINDSGDTLNSFLSLLIKNLKKDHVSGREFDFNLDTNFKTLNSVKFLTIFENISSSFKGNYSVYEINKSLTPELWITFPWERQFNNKQINNYQYDLFNK